MFGLVMTGHHEMIAGPGGGHVQQTQLLVTVHDELEVGPGLVVEGGLGAPQLELGSSVAPEHAHPDPRSLIPG